MQKSLNAVSTAYAANGTGPMVYGKYREHGYAVNPLTAQLGTFVPERASAAEAFQIAGLNWTAERRPVTFMGADGPLQSPDHVAIVRSDNDGLLGIHGTGYTPVQNNALVNLLDYLREDIQLETVLSIRNGRRVYATAAINTESEVLPGDRVRRYLHIFNSHDGSSGFGVFFGDVRLACAKSSSTTTGPCREHRGEGGVQACAGVHTSSVTDFTQKLPQLIDIERRSFAQSVDELRELTKVTLTPEIAIRVLQQTYADKLATPIRDKQTGDKRPRELSDLTEIGTIRSHYSGNTGLGINDIPGVRGTAYALFNAITQHATHDGGRAKDSTERARARLESLWGGTSAKRIDRAREACLALV